ncbi:hypothetical protein [Streptomyces indicus]|uniref:hypothetical protein n=1 Tax=Streptomyces indicus TaxID=417292 RepID=UPI001FE723D3|nr:hypothetical protein [Streptomyces indicus]
MTCVLAAGALVWQANDQQRQQAQNRSELKRACAGLLPERDLRQYLPDDSAGTLEEYGTMLDPGQESRALLDCTLSWGGGRWGPDAAVTIRAEALVAGQGDAKPGNSEKDPGDATPYVPQVDDFEIPLPLGAHGSTVAGERLEGSEVTASLKVECPNGLKGRTLPSRDLQVSVTLPAQAESEYDVPHADRLRTARTAVRVANWVTEKQNCGTGSITTKSAPAPRTSYEPSTLCAWLDPETLRFEEGDSTDTDGRPTSEYGWEWTSDSGFDERRGLCRGQMVGYSTGYEGAPIVDAIVQSWAGSYADGAYERFAETGHVPGARQRSPTRPDGSVTVAKEGTTLSLWARSRCDTGRSYHRITLTAEFPAVGDETKHVMSRSDRTEFSQHARATLDRYLADDKAWPKRSGCGDTKILGEVEEWVR